MKQICSGTANFTLFYNLSVSVDFWFNAEHIVVCTCNDYNIYVLNRMHATLLKLQKKY